jgi:flagellar basal body rod protein FlgB
MAATARARATGESLEQDMASLADTQLRYEATTKLLTQAYAQFRTAMNDRG